MSKNDSEVRIEDEYDVRKASGVIATAFATATSCVRDSDSALEFAFKTKSELDENSVRASYQQWKLEEGPITFEKLKVKQIETLANAIKTGIMKHDTKPVHKENLSVNMDLFIQNLPDDYEYPEPFVKCCAKLRRYVSWNDDILQIHYNDYGRYICRCMYKFTL